MPELRTLLRLARIGWVLGRCGVGILMLEAMGAPRALRAARFLLPWHWRRLPPRGVRLRIACEELGPIYVKFGQLLATRRDVLPPDVADELVKLQDRVPPFASATARRMIESAWGQPITQVLRVFEDTPLASASVAQVHAAVRHDGRAVIIKVLRPGVHRRVARDLAVLRLLSRALERVLREARRLRPAAVVEEFAITLRAELDLTREAGNAAQLKRNFEGSDELYVPEVYFDYTHPGVMMQERIHGIPMDDMVALAAAGVDFRLLAERGVEIFFRQVFEHNFFHADMHAGNIFVAPPARYIAVDFGIVGSLSLADRRYLAENFVAFFNRDYARVAEAHIRAGWVPAHTRADHFEAAVRAVCEPIFDKPLRDISFGHLLMRLLAVARSFDMEVQPQLVLLQKTLLSVEGLGRRLYPDLDLWRTAKPFLERWVDEQTGWRALRRTLNRELPRYAETLPALPNLLHDLMLMRALEHNGRQAPPPGPAPRRRTAIIATLALITVAIAGIYALAGQAPPQAGGTPVLVWVLLGLAAALLWPGSRR